MGLFNSIRLGASGAGGDYEVERSLRFNDGDSAYLNRTPSSAGNRKTFTLSVWVKRGSEFSDEEPILAADTTSAIRFSSEGGSDSKINIYYYSGGWVYRVHTNAELRDSAAWYHLVIAFDTTQATASNRIKIYQNGVQLTDMGNSDYPSQDYDTAFNNTVLHTIGRNGTSGDYFDGYMAEFNFIDGTALTPSSFGKTDSLTGQWIPKKYGGSYGTNGFYLNFSDNSGTTATTLGKDSSGNGNNFTPNNFVTGDSVKDSPTNNFCTLSKYGTPSSSGSGLAEGNLEFTTGSSGSGDHGNRLCFQTISPTSGKWYAEVCCNTTNYIFVGVHAYQVETIPTSGRTRWQGLYSYNGDNYLASTGSSASSSTYAASYGTNDIIGIYMDMDASPPQVYYSKNGQWANGSGAWNQSSPNGAISLGGSFFTEKTGGFTGLGINIQSSSSAAGVTARANFGQDSTFAGLTTAGGNTDANGIGDFKYTVPTNALALCTANLPDPAIKLPNKHFGTLIYEGNSSTQVITDTDAVDFTPDWVWTKRRDGSNSHLLFDSVRGVQNWLTSSQTTAEGTNAAFLTAFNNGGFTSGNNGDMNVTSRNYVAWNWNAGGSTVTNDDGSIESQVRANTTAGFSIVTYTGTGSNATIGHGLGVAPDAIIVKRRNGTQNWGVYHSSIAPNNILQLDVTNANYGSSGVFGNALTTSSVFSVNAGSGMSNGNGDTYVAYCFSEVAGYSKFGSYIGNGNADGTFIYTGFRPAWIMTKRSSDTGYWEIYDSNRIGYNDANYYLWANDNNAELTNNSFDILSNGFKRRTTGNSANASGSTYIYLCFAEFPFKYSRAR